MMTCTSIEDFDHNNYNSQSTIIVDVDPIIESSSIMESPPTNRRIKVPDNFLKSPTTVLDLMGNAMSDDDEDNYSDSYDGIDISENTNSEDDSLHQSLQEMITNSLSQIEGVMGEIMTETSSSSNLHVIIADDEESDDFIVPPPTILRARSTITSADMNLGSLQLELSNAEHEEKQHFQKTVMTYVEKISNELEETRKSTEELKNRIGRLRGQLAHRRALRNHIVRGKIGVEGENDNNSLPESLQDKPIPRQKDGKEKMNTPFTKRERRSWLSSRERKQPAVLLSSLLAAVERSSACRDADELLLSFQSLIVGEDDERKLSKEQQKQVETGRRKRFEKQDSWGSFVPKSRMMQPC